MKLRPFMTRKRFCFPLVLAALLASCAKLPDDPAAGDLKAAEVVAVPLKTVGLLAQVLIGTAVGVVAVPFGEDATRDAMLAVMEPIEKGTDGALNMLLKAGGSNVRLVGRKGFEVISSKTSSVRVPVDSKVIQGIEEKTGRRIFRSYAIYDADTGETVYLDEAAA